MNLLQSIEQWMGSFSMPAVAAIAFCLGLLVAATAVLCSTNNYALKKLRESKDQFVALTSHYLLTPISIIQGALSRLQEADSTIKAPERAKLYDAIQKGQQRLWILAEEFVLVNQIEEGNLVLNVQVGNIAQMIDDAVTALNVFIREKEAKVSFFDRTTTTHDARFDLRRMKQAVIAIIDNAIKFSPQGAAITVELFQEDAAFSIRVIDKGAGMTADSIRDATEAFARGTSSYTFDHEGIGLGLFTANAIIREHGGELLFNSSKQGTEVVMRFPSI